MEMGRTLSVGALAAAVWITSSFGAGMPRAAAQYGGSIPRHCGMSAGYEIYGPLAPGVTVVLGMHTPWAGDANWSPEMNGFVGRPARITRLGGVDTQGCPGIHVDADGGQYFWRIRDVQLGGMAGSAVGVAPMDLPRSCDMSAGAVQYGPVGPGSVVMLGVHTPWRGDANWTPEMFRFAGNMARITSYEGVDNVGCPVVRVDVDGGQYFWRLRDMQIAGPSMPMGAGVAVPGWCEMTERTTTYGPIAPGSVILLGRHSPWSGDTNWAPEMERYVGARATVTSLGGLDTMGCPGVRVDVDGGQFFWRIRDVRF